MVNPTLYFYDLETSGFNARRNRIMQFAGQRTLVDLQPIGQPHNFYIKLTDDILPDPDAILVTGITPALTKKKGLTEAEFLKIFYKEIAVSGTIFVGYNSIRFDDEFMRFLNYRNFRDAYEWQWKNGRSRWDLLDVVRITRALRPAGIKWPHDTNGKKSNQLGLLTSINKLSHSKAHDALNDVWATISLAELIKSKQPKLFQFMLDMRKKDKIKNLVNSDQPFVYTSGKYPSETEKTTVAIKLAEHPGKQGVLVYDLRHDPSQFAEMNSEQLAAIWRRPKDEEDLMLPIKTLQFNRCPAVAPLSVLDGNSLERLELDMDHIEENLQKLKAIKKWPANLIKALKILDEQRQASTFEEPSGVDSQLYEGFFDDQDRRLMQAMLRSDSDKFSDFVNQYKDKRLQELVPLYKARNFPESLDKAEQEAWLDFCKQQLLDGQPSRLDEYLQRIDVVRQESQLSNVQKHLLDELEDYGKKLSSKLV